MSQVINTNIMSLNAQRNLQSSSASLSSTIQRLSSGLRINSAKDDAAGLAISERFSTQIRGMDQAARNANDGISMAQTAEGALSEIGNNLQRIRELSVQARNATNSESDRKALNAEVQLLKAEIQRVAEQTNFNGTKLLDGSFQAQAFQIGADQGETIAIAQIANANIADLGYYNKADTAATMNAVAAQSSGGSAKVTGGTMSSTITGGVTTAATNGKVTFDAAGLIADYFGTNKAVKFDVKVGTDAAKTITLNTNITDAAGLASALNTAMVAAGIPASQATATNNAGVITIAHVDTAAAGATSAIVVNNFQPESAATPTALPTMTATPGQDETTTGGTATFGVLAAGDVEINGIDLGAITSGETTQSDAVDNIIAAFDAKKQANPTELGDITATNVGGKLVLTSTNGVKIDIAGNGLAKAGLVAGETDVSNPVYQASTFKLSGEKGAATISVDQAGSASQRASNLVTAINNQSYNTGVTASLKDGKVVLSSAEGNFTVEAVATGTQTATEAEAALKTRTGLTAGTTDNFVEGAAAVGFADLDISTELGADNAILAMDAALNQINSSRAELGAIQNRFTSVVSSLNVNSENLSAARSRIRDTDFAKETAELTRTQILQQAGTAMLAQANQSSQNVLSLLR